MDPCKCRLAAPGPEPFWRGCLCAPTGPPSRPPVTPWPGCDVALAWYCRGAVEDLHALPRTMDPTPSIQDLLAAYFGWYDTGPPGSPIRARRARLLTLPACMAVSLNRGTLEPETGRICKHPQTIRLTPTICVHHYVGALAVPGQNTAGTASVAWSSTVVARWTRAIIIASSRCAPAGTFLTMPMSPWSTGKTSPTLQRVATNRTAQRSCFMQDGTISCSRACLHRRRRIQAGARMPSSSPTNGDECIFRQYRPTMS